MKPKCATSGKKPCEIKRGNVTVKIYTANNRVGGTDYPQYTLVYYSGKQRLRKNFGDFGEAKREGELVALKLANGENEVLKLSSLDRNLYLQSCALLKPLNLPLNVATHEYVNAVKRLPVGTTLHQAVDFFLNRNPANMPQRTVREVVDELVEIKTKAGRGEVHLKDLTGRLGKFANGFQMNISQVTGLMIEKYLTGLEVTGRTKINHLRLITSLFKFAIKRRYLAKDSLDEVEAVEKPEEDQTEIQIFSPSELKRILSAARPELIPWLAIAAFAGLRSAELQRLDWSEVNLTERHIEVPALKSKTASRRLVPITPNLSAWLTPFAKNNGQVTFFANVAKQIGWLVESVNDTGIDQNGKAETDPKGTPKFEWKRNGLRHSFISYRLAAIKDTAEVALEAGNSPTMIFRHYRKLVTESEANKWFAVIPHNEPNSVDLLEKIKAA